MKCNPSRDKQIRINNLVAVKAAQIWDTMNSVIMQDDLYTAQLYTVADNVIEGCMNANEVEIDHCVMELKASIRANMRKEDVDVFQLKKQFIALNIMKDLLQAIHNDDHSTVWEQSEDNSSH